jgi:hypothetical protein
MKQIISPIFLAFLIISTSCQNNEIDSFSINELNFDLWIASKNDIDMNEHIYCLLGTGFFKTPRADNTDSIIKQWIVNHPDAIVIPVYTFGPTMSADPNSKQTYCWVVENNDTLNIHLVKLGAVPGGTMMHPKTWQQMTRKER